MSSRALTIGTRGSRLARAQANSVAESLRRRSPDIEIEVVVIRTEGDSDRTTSLERMGGVGVFTKKIERELSDGKIDLAVHSAKDLPSQIPEGLTIAAVPLRGAIEDVWLSREEDTLTTIRSGAVVGTGAPRRRAQLLNVRPKLTVVDIRGNIETRLEKLAAGDYDALIMAQAGLDRLGFTDRITERLSPETFLPAPGQGALVVEARADDVRSIGVAGAVDDLQSHRCLTVERMLLSELGAGCSAALGGWARFNEPMIRLTAVVLDRDGGKRAFASHEIALEEENEALVKAVADSLVSQGARDMIERQNGQC